jgi:hypothetical protein
MSGSRKKVREMGRRDLWEVSKLVCAPVPGLAAVAFLTLSGIEGGHIGIFGWLPSASGLCIGIGLLFAVIAAILRARSASRLRALDRETPGLRERAALGEEVMLRLAREELSSLRALARHFSSERVSLYRHESDGFTLIARCSAAPPFQESLGREVLPLESGILAKAWLEGQASALDLPEAGGVNEPPSDEWVTEQYERFAIEPAIARGFQMRSQSYAAFRLADASGDGEGVIVFESTLALANSAEGQRPMMGEEELAPLVAEAGPRLIRLLKTSQSLGRSKVREQLLRTQGPDRHGPAGEGS